MDGQVRAENMFQPNYPMKAKCICSLAVCFAVTFVAQAQDPFTNGLVAYYPFNGNVNDESGNGYDGSVQGAILVSDRFGTPASAYGFNGVNDEIVISNTANLHLSDNGLSLCAWVALTGNNADGQIVGKHICGTQTGYFLGCVNNKPYFFVGNNTQWLEAPNALPTDSSWHLVVGSFDGSTQRLYVDGVLVKSMPRTYLLLNAALVKIGRFAGCTASVHFLGFIDDVRIYDRALSESEVTQLYQNEVNLIPYLSVTVKTIRISMLVKVGTTNQLESSSDLNTWNPYGSPFVATNSNVYEDVDILNGQRYFRIHQLP